jgi:hypothetical protein
LVSASLKKERKAYDCRTVEEPERPPPRFREVSLTSINAYYRSKKKNNSHSTQISGQTLPGLRLSSKR